MLNNAIVFLINMFKNDKKRDLDNSIIPLVVEVLEMRSGIFPVSFEVMD